jgi:hypothetical protein
LSIRYGLYCYLKAIEVQRGEAIEI